MNSITLTPLSGAFGVEVGGIDVARPVASDTMAALADAFVAHRLLLLRDQRPTPEAFAAFARLWGDPRVGDAPSPLDVPGIPGMGMVGNSGDHAPLPAGAGHRWPDGGRGHAGRLRGAGRHDKK
jgi:alpha-ketoglutarate-dependent taurine dioxygenase